MAFGKKPAPKTAAPAKPAAPKAVATARPPGEQAPPISFDPAKLERIYREAIELERHYMTDYLEQTNASLPDGVSVEPFMMVPGECWNGPLGDFLLKFLELSPFGSWNVVFLPSDQRSADELGIPPHPGRASKDDIDWISNVLRELAILAKDQSAEVDRIGGGEREHDALQLTECERMYEYALGFGATRIGQEWLEKALWRFSAKEGMARVA